jgi:hypothetical protein
VAWTVLSDTRRKHNQNEYTRIEHLHSPEREKKKCFMVTPHEIKMKNRKKNGSASDVSGI